MTDLVLRLNARWRIVCDGQWILEQRVRNSSARDTGWSGRKYIRHWDHLLELTAELCGDVDPDAIATIKSWPMGYVTWKLLDLQDAASPSAVSTDESWAVG